MEKNIINFLSKKSYIHKYFFPMDLMFISERIGLAQNDETIEIKSIQVKEINYIGIEKSNSVSHISLCFNPLLII